MCLLKTPTLVTSNSPPISMKLNVTKKKNIKHHADWPQFKLKSQTQVGSQCCPATLSHLSSPFSLQDDYFVPSPVSSHLQNFLPHPHSQMSLASDFTEKKQKQSEKHVHIYHPHPDYWPAYIWARNPCVPLLVKAPSPAYALYHILFSVQETEQNQ